ncbi:MAG: radical SAM protein [Clostridia bacterium]|nr:radical SAM protein [Clostridia bacterium]
MIKDAMTGLNIELTRRCNMNCPHCAKGEPQNIDISKEIIDKTFDEVGNIYIRTIRITGGEPFLNPDGLEYLVDSMINHKIKVRHIEVFTNGSIQNNNIAKSLQRLCAYLNTIQSDVLKYENCYFGSGHIISDNPNNLNRKTKAGEVYCIVSQQYHRNIFQENTVSYYKNKVDMDNFFINLQNATIFKNIWKNLEGNLLKNYKSFSKRDLQAILIKNNRFCIINDDCGKRIIEKTITVSANGNVFAGNLIAYEKVDREVMILNISDCQNNFMDLIDLWCWKHPINHITNRKYEEYMAYEWLKDKGLLCSGSPLNKYKDYPVSVSDYVKAAEQDLIKIHHMLPYLSHNEIEEFYTLDFCMQMGINDVTKFFLRTFSKYDENSINVILNTPGYFKAGKMKLAIENEVRKIQAKKGGVGA